MVRKMLAMFLVLAMALGMPAMAEAEKTTVQFYFPVQLGGAAAELLEQFVAEFD